MDLSTWRRRLPSSPGGICPSLTPGILCVLQGPTSNPLSFSLPGETWVVFSILTLQAQEPYEGSAWTQGTKGNPGELASRPTAAFPWRIFSSLLPTCLGLGSAQVSCCSSAHQLFHMVIQIPCVALSRPPCPCAVRRQTLPGACEFEYSWLAGSQGLSCSELRSVRGALNGRIVSYAERSRHGVSNYSSFQTTASCFGLLEQ